MNPRLFLVPFVAFTVVALVACGGGKKNNSASSDNSSSSSSSSQSSSSSTATGTLDLSKTGDQLASLKSFHFDLAMKLDAGSAATPSSGSGSNSDADLSALILGFLSDVKASGAFVAPDKVDLTVKIAGQDIGFITIGDKSWVKFGNTWQAGDPSDSLSSDSGSASDFLKDNLSSSGDVLKGAKTSQETVNGVKATRYSWDKAALEKATKDAGEDTTDFKTLDKANLDVWMNSDNIPVKLAVTINGKDDAGKKVAMDFQMNIKDINSNITIKPPI